MRALTSLRAETSQQQLLTPRMQQAVRLLQMSSLDFGLELQDTVDQNPFLELLEEYEPSAAIEEQETSALQNSLAASAQDAEPGMEEAGQRENSWSEVVHASNADGGNSFDIIDVMEAKVPLRQHLCKQLGMMRLSPREHHLACVFAESVDDDGYLRLPLEDLQQLAGLSPMPDERELIGALRCVQSLEPCGVAARNVEECLLLQIDDSVADLSKREMARRLVVDHLGLLTRRDFRALAIALSTDLDTVLEICNDIRRLKSRPGLDYCGDMAQYIVPDVIVHKRRNGKWHIRLNQSVVPKIRVNQHYADLFRRHRQPCSDVLSAHLQEARWTVRNIEQRFDTIMRVSQAIIEKQAGFLEFGPLAMRPMGLREIAESVGLHESTISRVTNNKYMATPTGIFELKYFFSRGLDTTHGQQRSAVSVRSTIQRMISEEKTGAPLSDAEIARRLARRGLTVARRTVTKYRQGMHIAAVGMRRARQENCL